jgi:hypothetical protein
MLSKMRDYFFPRPIRDLATLRRFLSGEASYIAQRTTYEFARNTLAWFGQHHFGDDRFNDAFRICRWEAYAAILADMVVLTRGHLLPAAPSGDALAAPLLQVYRNALAEYADPAHRPEGWRDAEDGLLQRLRALNDDDRPDARRVSAASAARTFETLPLYSADKAEDRRVIGNAIAFGLISFADRLRVRVDADVVVRLLSDTGRLDTGG